MFYKRNLKISVLVKTMVLISAFLCSLRTAGQNNVKTPIYQKLTPLTNFSFGGTKADIVQDMVSDSSGYLYYVGYTFSSDFPTVNAAFPDMPGGPDYLPQDGFVAKVDPNTGEILFSSYIGGSENSEYAYSVAVDDSGNVFVAGVTNSHDFPVLNAFQDTLRGYSDGYLMKFNSAGEFMFSTYFGGDSVTGSMICALMPITMYGYRLWYWISR